MKAVGFHHQKDTTLVKPGLNVITQPKVVGLFVNVKSVSSVPSMSPIVRVLNLEIPCPNLSVFFWSVVFSPSAVF